MVTVEVAASSFRLVLFELRCFRIWRSTEVGAVNIQPQSDVQRCNRTYSRSNIYFHLWHGKELIQNKAFQSEERHNRQEHNERAIEKNHLERAVVLRVLKKGYMTC